MEQIKELALSSAAKAGLDIKKEPKTTMAPRNNQKRKILPDGLNNLLSMGNVLNIKIVIFSYVINTLLYRYSISQKLSCGQKNEGSYGKTLHMKINAP